MIDVLSFLSDSVSLISWFYSFMAVSMIFGLIIIFIRR